MECAIHNLMYRVAGRLTPTAELVRFDMEIDGQTVMYPVLVSETIPEKAQREWLTKISLE